jgi:hypothetical protein
MVRHIASPLSCRTLCSPSLRDLNRSRHCPRVPGDLRSGLLVVDDDDKARRAGITRCNPYVSHLS